jgi:small subunit ribosomal protein S18
MRGRPKRKRSSRSQDAMRFRGAGVKMEEINYKNVALLQRLTSAQGKLFSRKRTGLPAEMQRRAALALKRARFIALMPFVT